MLLKLDACELKGWKTPVPGWRKDLEDFLEEWFDGRDHVWGHTSGSTGRPKKIRLYKQDMRASARLTNGFFGLDGSSVLMLSLSTDYIAGKMMVVRALEAGARLWVGGVSSHPFRDLPPGSGRVSLAAVVPMQLEESMGEEREAMDQVGAMLVGGAPVSPELEERIAGLSAVCYATYGMTETVSHVALRRLGRDRLYTALDGVSFTLDGRGCLVIHAPHLKTEEFVTNDVARLEDSRRFEWLGRFDHVINSGGIKFFPEIIERKMAGMTDCRFFISSRPDVRLGERIVLVLERDRMDGETERLFLESLRSRLSAYEVPREILYLPHFYETSSGKVIRRTTADDGPSPRP